MLDLSGLREAITPFPYTRVGELQIGFQDIALLPSQGSFHTTFRKNIGRGESLMTATCHKTVVVGNQGHGMLPIIKGMACYL